MKLNVPHNSKPRVVIIGGGFGGLSLTKKLAKSHFQVVVIDKNNYHTFQPLLYQVATGGLEPDSIAYPLRKIFKGQKNVLFRVAEVTKILPEEKRIETNIGILRYDFLVIATGSTTNFFGNENVMANGMPMKSIPEALDLRSLILQNFEKALMIEDEQKKQAYLNIVIVGGGATGVETAGALSELKNHVLPADYPELDLNQMRITIVQNADRLLNSMSTSSSSVALESLQKMNVDVLTEVRVQDYDGTVVQLSNGQNLYSKCVIWSAGVKGKVIPGLEKAEIFAGGRYRVNEYNSVSPYQDIFAIGDVAAVIGPSKAEPDPMLAPAAVQQGENLAKNLLAISNKQALTPFLYKNKGTMATIGRNKAVVEIGKFQFGGFIAWLSWMFLHLILLVGFRNKLVVLINWFVNYFSYDRGVRLIIRPFIHRNHKNDTNE